MIYCKDLTSAQKIIDEVKNNDIYDTVEIKGVMDNLIHDNFKLLDAPSFILIEELTDELGDWIGAVIHIIYEQDFKNKT